MTSSARSSLASWLLKLTSIAACLLVWQAASKFRINLGVVTFTNVPAPTDVLEAAVALAQSSKVFDHVSSSLRRVGVGYVIAACLGIALGLAVGRSRRAADLLLPPLELLRPIPAVAWIPLAVLMFPSSEASMIYITFIGALFPILLNTVHGVENVDARLIASAQSLGASRGAILREVVIPAAAPSIVTGLAIGMGTSWFCLVTAEMISGQFGIGYYTWESYILQNYPDIVVGMVLIGVLGMGSSVLLRWLGARLTPWNNLEGARR
ncbi:ABC transporter permease [Hyphomicrobium facile]|uniref:NitT/TauT family transport system permease protein n=1 Tax=Hyphomicrobium facile TaxID=51670 RepID=A0A1I7MUQ7_9HYPH|nr:ABC transporter permease [Hyphomicrobium facile]SFV26139.1 NitT/TauT family transport system permease protein [Hyphomicrobium facile]